MPCDPDELRHVPLFELLDDDEAKILAARVEIKRFAPRENIFKIGDIANHGYVLMSGMARVTTTDEDQMEVVVDEPAHGDFFGFASMLQQTAHQTTAVATEEHDRTKSAATTHAVANAVDRAGLMRRSPSPVAPHRAPLTCLRNPICSFR